MSGGLVRDGSRAVRDAKSLRITFVQLAHDTRGSSWTHSFCCSLLVSLHCFHHRANVLSISALRKDFGENFGSRTNKLILEPAPCCEVAHVMPAYGALRTIGEHTILAENA